jgi:hypothetical protein
MSKGEKERGGGMESEEGWVRLQIADVVIRRVYIINLFCSNTRYE